MSIKKILVAIDFTEVSNAAVGHGHHLAKRIGGEVHLLHLVDKESQREEALHKLNEFKQTSVARLGTEVAMHTLVNLGDILTEIGATATRMEASMVIIGTHGLQGMEYIVGTHAVRIVGSADVPFITVQEKPIKANGYENIIVPMDLHSESKQNLSHVAELAKIFDSQVHIIIPHEKDEFLQNALKRNLKYAETFFANQGIKHTTTVGVEDSDDLDEDVLKLAVKKEADLIAIMNWRETRLLGIFGSDLTQDFIINKAMIPVLVMNPKLISDFEFFGTTTS